MLTAQNNKYGNIIDLERFVPDGRLTEPSNGKVYDYRQMLEYINYLGRSLTEDEAEKFRK